MNGCFWGHRWSKWTMLNVPRWDGKTVSVQTRHCVKCVKVEVEQIRI